ncbi:hypothetical protein [Herbaspirillum seropedicae]|uniref:competence protein CoiA family protein n=1 Tax=Herbaspirillum seropedicae TaxID=964 RepID=UPI0012EA90A6|nr:hypothetical protein [Herbaspirillum seropedicae]
MQIRTAAGRVPHFYHLTTPEHCEGDKKETPEHQRLKCEVALAAIGAGWEVETEAAERNTDTGKVKWRADVLATRGKVRIAFEIQLSNADWHDMLARQKRYETSNVRALWLVKTKKGFPATKELPIFTVEGLGGKDWVFLSTRWDNRFTWHETSATNQVELPRFIHNALGGHLKWSPRLAAKEAQIETTATCVPVGGCEGCERTLIRALNVSAFFAADRSYPGYYWRPDVTSISTSNWANALAEKIWHNESEGTDVAFLSPSGACMWCGVVHTRKEKQLAGAKMKLTSQLLLGDLPPVSPGTVEWDWLHRWVLV